MPATGAGAPFVQRGGPAQQTARRTQQDWRPLASNGGDAHPASLRILQLPMLATAKVDREWTAARALVQGQPGMSADRYIGAAGTGTAGGVHGRACSASAPLYCGGSWPMQPSVGIPGRSPCTRWILRTSSGWGGRMASTPQRARRAAGDTRRGGGCLRHGRHLRGRRLGANAVRPPPPAAHGRRTAPATANPPTCTQRTSERLARRLSPHHLRAAAAALADLAGPGQLLPAVSESGLAQQLTTALSHHRGHPTDV